MGHLAHLITVPTNTHLCKVTCECVFASFMTLHYKKLELPLSKDAMFQILLKYSSDSEEEDETEKLTDGRQTTGVQKSFRDFSSSKLIILFEKKWILLFQHIQWILSILDIAGLSMKLWI